MDTTHACHQSYLASVTRRRRAERIRAQRANLYLWCGVTLLYILMVALVVTFSVYDG